MNNLPQSLRELVESGPLVHLSTVNADGSPQVTVIWVGVDGNELVSGHLGRNFKIRNIERDPRVVLSLEAPRVHDAVLSPYAVVRARARIEASEEAWDLLDRLAKVYVDPPITFPVPKVPGYLVRYAIERVGGVGPWVSE